MGESHNGERPEELHHEGDSLKDAIEQFHGRASGRKRRKPDVDARDGVHVGLTPRRSPEFASLEFRKLLGHFVDVCNAIQYAHDRGVLHRDMIARQASTPARNQEAAGL